MAVLNLIQKQKGLHRNQPARMWWNNTIYHQDLEKKNSLSGTLSHHQVIRNNRGGPFLSKQQPTRHCWTLQMVHFLAIYEDTFAYTSYAFSGIPPFLSCVSYLVFLLFGTNKLLGI